MAKKQETYSPFDSKPRKKTEFDKAWEKMFKEAERLSKEHIKKKEPSKKDGSK